MTQRLRRWVAAAALAVALVAIGGCGADERTRGPGAPPRAYHPERFPDIPLPPDFGVDERHDQLAMVLAGGLVRRFEVRLIQKAHTKTQRPEDVLAWYDRVLPGQGWERAASELRTRAWRKRAPEGPGEELAITVARSGRTTVQFRLRPLPNVGG